MTAHPSLFDDAETLSTLEALNDVADTVETVVISFGGGQERNAYLALAGEYDDYADTLPKGAATRTPEQNARLSGLGKQTEEAFEALLHGSPATSVHRTMPCAPRSMPRRRGHKYGQLQQAVSGPSPAR